MAWHGRLSLHYTRDGERTVGHDRHDGPLRVLRGLYPEGGAVCHHVLVHPPGGVVGGDELHVALDVEAGAHALVTTPGATRFYRSAGPAAVQGVDARVAAGARLEWLPLESIAYPGCVAENRLRFVLEPGAESIGCDVLALGLPAAGEPFGQGRFVQHVEVPGVWLERGVIDAADAVLVEGTLGLAGASVLATLWFAAGTALAPARRDALLDAARDAASAGRLAARAGVTSPQPEVVVLRALADRVEPATALLRAVWSHWREVAWNRRAVPPRVWST